MTNAEIYERATDGTSIEELAKETGKEEIEIKQIIREESSQRAKYSITSVKVDYTGNTVPEVIKSILYKRMGEIDEQIKSLSQEYKAIAEYIG